MGLKIEIGRSNKLLLIVNMHLGIELAANKYSFKEEKPNGIGTKCLLVLVQWPVHALFFCFFNF